MHPLYAQSTDSFPATVTITFKVDQMDDEPIQGILHSCLQEVVCAHTISMEDANLTSVIRPSLVIDLIIVCVSSFIVSVWDVFAHELYPLTQDKLPLIELLQCF